jgi:hypothetical protein
VPRSTATHPGVTDADPAESARADVRQTVYAPVYPYVYTEDRSRPFNLAATLYVRNTDPRSPLFVTSVRLHDSGGALVRDETPRPLRLAPLATAEFFVKESDVAAGSSASFLVEWAAAGPVSEPIVETVMIGTLSNQGISFTCIGRPVASRLATADQEPADVTKRKD